MHLFTAYYIYKDKQSDWQVRIGWKTFNHKDHEDSTRSKKENGDVIEEDIEPGEKNDDSDGQTSGGKTEALESGEETNTRTSETECKKQSWFEKIKCTITEVCDKIKMVLEFLKAEPHKLTFNRVKKEIIRLLVSLKPKKLRGKVRFGMEDPYQTGQILAALSVLYPIYGDNVEIFPEFEQKILEGDVYIKGHVRGIHAVKMVFNIIIDKNVRMTIKDIKTLFESN